MYDPVKRAGGWFVDTEDGESGPWKTEEAAQAIADGDIIKANMIEARSIKKELKK